VRDVAFSSDGNTLAASTAGTTRLWDVRPIAELRRNDVRNACTRAGGPLDQATWEIYAPDVPFRDTCAS
jgi:WD40 repeat protein